MTNVIRVFLIFFLLIPGVVIADSYAEDTVVEVAEVVQTVRYCTADCLLQEKMFIGQDLSISCEVLYCPNELCELKPSSISNCEITK